MRDAEGVVAAHRQATAELDHEERAEAASSPPSNAHAASGSAAVQRMIVATRHSGLNLRSSASFGDNVMGQLRRGEAVEITGAPQNGFVTVKETNGILEGWASSHFLRDEHAPPPTRTHGEKKPSTAQKTAEALKASSATTTGDKVAVTPAVITGIQRVPDSKQEMLEFGRLYEVEPGDKADIDPYDVHQGNLGDCYFLAACAAVARANPELIRRLIKQVGDNVYDVTLYETKDGPHFWSEKEKSPRVIRVTSAFEATAEGSVDAKYAQSQTCSDDGPELWVQLLEKAYAVLRGGYAKVNGGGSPADGLSALLAGGVTTYEIHSRSADENCALIHDALAQHRAVTADLGLHGNNFQVLGHKLATKYAWFDHVFGDSLIDEEERRARQLNAVSEHVYAVKSVDMKAKKISFQNPWHARDLDDLAFEDFELLFRRFAVADR